MQCIILATGEHSALQALAPQWPSPMLPILNRPVLVYALEALARSGVKQVSMCVHHLAGCIESYCGDGSRWGLQITYHLLREPLGSAGAVRRAAGTTNEPALILPGDMLLEEDISELLAAYQANPCEALACLHTPRGEAEELRAQVGSGGWLASALKDEQDGYALTGAFILSAAAIVRIPPRTRMDLGGELIPALLAQGKRIYGHVCEGYWSPLRSSQAFAEAQRYWLDKATTLTASSAAELTSQAQYAWLNVEARRIANGIWAGKGILIHPRALLSPPVYLGDHCQIGADVELGPYAVIGPDVIVDDEATVRDSTILERTYVGRLVNLEGRLVNQATLMNTATGESVEVVDHFLLAPNAPPSVGASVARLGDLLGATIWIILTLPLTVVVGLLTWLSCRGRLITWQPRVGAQRTVASDQSPSCFSLPWFCMERSDGQRTRFGRWLQSWEGHRLLEAYAVLFGKLRLVGVKPLTPDEAAQVQEEWQRRRYEHPAGLTGLWYVQTPPDGSLDQVLVADAYYVANRSWRYDLALLWRTAGAWWRQTRAWNRP